MPWGVAAGAIAAGGSIYAANQAADASQAASDAAIAEQRRQFNTAQQNMAPWLRTGESALNRLASLYGLGDGTPNYDWFKQSPGYQFALNQGLQGLDRSAAARGSLYSGGHNADVLHYAEGLASQNFNNYANRLAGIAGVGQTTATGLGALGQRSASNIGNIGMNNARNQSRSIYQNANTIGNLAFGLGGWANRHFGQNPVQQPGQQQAGGVNPQLGQNLLTQPVRFYGEGG